MTTSGARTLDETHNAEGSTLRLSLGCHLSEELGLTLRRVGNGKRLTWTRAGEAALNQWMGDHTRVAWMEHPEPWVPERVMIQEMVVPLNLDHNAKNPHYPNLKALRARHKALARELPIVPEG